MPRPLGSKNGIHKPQASNPQVLLQKIVSDETLPLEARQSALQALEACKPASPPPPQASSQVSWFSRYDSTPNLFAGCGEWPGDGHRDCVYDSQGMYREGGTHTVACLIDPTRTHSFPFQEARAAKALPDTIDLNDYKDL